MSANTAERNFPVLHLADGPGREDPTEARKRMLKQLADRLDEHHVFTKGQFVVWMVRRDPGRHRRGGREIQSHGGCGDDLDVEIGKAEAGGGALKFAGIKAD